MSQLRPTLLRLRPRLPTTTANATPLLRRTLIAAPKPNSGPLMTRRADRALPSIHTSSSMRWKLSLPLFGLLIAASTAAIFNYQKMSSPVVESTMYALRTHPRAREVLGSEVYFAQPGLPWIWGSIDQLHGRVDISYGVRGRAGRGTVRFRSERVGGRMGHVSLSPFFLFARCWGLVFPVFGGLRCGEVLVCAAGLDGWTAGRMKGFPSTRPDP